MKAITLLPGTAEVLLTEIPEPFITQPDQIKIKIIQVGICGTDREQAAGGRSDAPEGHQRLVIGHEMFGQVVETGKLVHQVKKGDYGVFTVRRGCNECEACRNNRTDMCYTGKYTERGIKGADGFQAEFVVDQQQYFIPVPSSIKDIGVLTEPMSVAMKAIDEAIIIQQARLRNFDDEKNWMKGKKALIAGIGPIGLMAAFALRLRGAEVLAMDIVEESELRVQILQKIGGTYIDGRKLDVMDIDEVFGGCDFVFEATGIAKLQIQLIDTLAVNGIYVATGIPSGQRPATIRGAEIMQQLVLKNQIMIGSVNASPAHYQMAVDQLGAINQLWPETLQSVITEKVDIHSFQQALASPGKGEIKVVVDWTL